MRIDGEENEQAQIATNDPGDRHRRFARKIHGDARITSQGYEGKVEFLTDGTTEFHISPQDLGVAFRTGQSLNPVDRGHIAFRTDDIEAFKAMRPARAIRPTHRVRREQEDGRRSNRFDERPHQSADQCRP